MKKIRILAIDDEEDILYTLKAIGTAVGWSVYALNDSLLAVESMRLHKPDIILLDYHMPQQNGILTLKKLRRVNRQVPIIVLTVDERQKIANEFILAGASDFATKPIRVPDLVARIQVHLRLVEKQREAEGKAIVSKSINEATMQKVLNSCQTIDGWFYAEDAVHVTGLAYQTTVRYLQYLVTEDILESMNDYGKVGRPRNRYRVK